MSRIQHAATLVALIGSVLTLGSGAAMAEPDSDTATRVTMGMHIVDFDPEVAAAHGYEIRQTPDGREYSVPVNTPANAPAPRGFDEVVGDCGSSYINFNGTGSGTLATLATGFEVIEPAVSYGWEVDIIDSAGVSVQEWGGELPSTPTWDGFRTLDLAVGEASASVDSDFSFAVLASGAICTSGGPATTTDIF